MNKTFKRFIAVVLAALLITVCACLLFACDPEDKERERQERDRQQRTEYVTVFENVFLGAMNENWGTELGVADIADMDADGGEAADYLIAKEWADFVGEVLIDSSLQTGKLGTLKDVVTSDEGKALIENFSENSSLILPLLRSVGFTPTDISGLVHDLLVALVAESGKVFDGIIARAEEVRAYTEVSVAMRASMGKLSADMGAAKESLVPTSAERDEMLAAFEKAEEPMSALIEFVYNMSLGSDGDLLDMLLGGDGALADISNGEIKSIVSALRANISELKTALEGDAIANLNGAFDLIIEKFDTNSVQSVVYAQIVEYSRSAYMLVDVIPYMCDMAYSAVDVFNDDALLDALKATAGKELGDYSKFANSSIITAKIAIKLTDEFSQDTLNKLIDDISAQSMGDYRKSVPLTVIDLMLNVSQLLGGLGDENFDFDTVHGDIIDGDTFSQIFSTMMIVLDSQIAKFKVAYDAYIEDIADGRVDYGTYEKLVSAGAFLKPYDTGNPYNDRSETVEWAQWYLNNMATVRAAIDKVADANNKKLEADIKLFIEEFYCENSAVRAAVVQLADMPILSDDISEEEYKSYLNLAVNGRIVGLMSIFNLGSK